MQTRNPSNSRRHGGLPLWTLFLPVVVLTALIAAPPQSRLYSALFSSATFAAMQCLMPECRFRVPAYLCPLNLAMLLFLFKLVVLPLFVMVMQPEQGTLPLMPGRRSMDLALLVETAAYVAFCVALRFVPARSKTTGISGALASLLESKPGLVGPAVFGALGAVGFLAAFGSIGNLLQYFTNPTILTDLVQETEGSMRALAGTIFRPFVAFAFILLWCRRVDRHKARGENSYQIWATAAVAIGVVTANLTFSFNRGAFVFPLLSLVAVYISRVRRISPAVFASLALLVMIPILSIGSYRSNAKPGPTVLSSKPSLQNVSEQVQVYLAAPQFLAFLLDYTGWGRTMYWGSTLVASALDPVPLIGKSFRDRSGVVIYNRAIYGNTGNLDQNVPLQGELFINFHMAGVVAGYFGLGLLIALFQRCLEQAETTFAAFAIQYVAAWAAMLVVWSLAVFCQILIYFCWPIYCYLGWNWFKRWAGNLNRRPAGLRAQVSFSREPAEGLL